MVVSEFQQPLEKIHQAVVDPDLTLPDANLDIDLARESLKRLGATIVCLGLPHFISSELVGGHREAPIAHESYLMPDVNPGVISKNRIHSPYGVNGATHTLLNARLLDGSQGGNSLASRLIRLDVRPADVSLITSIIIDQASVARSSFGRYLAFTAR